MAHASTGRAWAFVVGHAGVLAPSLDRGNGQPGLVIARTIAADK
jgi:hypothetical protein